MDWDWEDGPPRDTPPASRPPEEPRPSAEQGSPQAAEQGSPQPAPPEPLDESETQVFSADTAWEQQGERKPVEGAPQSPPPEYVLPERTETGRPVGHDAPESAYLPKAAAEAGELERRPPSQDRAARREQRRRRLRRQRLIALAVLVAIVVLAVVLVIRGCGDPDSAAAATLGVAALGRRLVAPSGQQ